MHSREQIIYQRKKHIERKKYTLTKIWQNDFPWWRDDGRLSKNKIHCSCPMCAEKTNIKTMRHYSTYHKAGSRLKKNWKISDLRKLYQDSD
jgi:hypothetical protein